MSREWFAFHGYNRHITQIFYKVRILREYYWPQSISERVQSKADGELKESNMGSYLRLIGNWNESKFMAMKHSRMNWYGVVFSIRQNFSCCSDHQRPRDRTRHLEEKVTYLLKSDSLNQKFITPKSITNSLSLLTVPTILHSSYHFPSRLYTLFRISLV